MNSITRTVVVALLTFASGLIGFWVQSFVPAPYLADAKGMVGSVVGLVTLLLALVLGLLVWTSYGVYTVQVSESQSLGPIVLQLDLALERYGRAARRGWDLLHDIVLRSRERFWGAGRGGPVSIRRRARTWPRSPNSSPASILRPRSRSSSPARRGGSSSRSSRRPS